MGSGLSFCLPARLTIGSNNLADARVVQSEIVSDLLHGIATARVGRSDRAVSLRVIPGVISEGLGLPFTHK